MIRGGTHQDKRRLHASRYILPFKGGGACDVRKEERGVRKGVWLKVGKSTATLGS